MKKIYIGTSGYSYSDWKGIFYPEKMRNSDFLEYYARYFNFVELNFSYYQKVKRKTLLNMSSKVPENFIFIIKAYQNLTHLRTNEWKEDASDFVDNLSILNERGQLGGVLLQFPFSFHYNPDNRIYLSKLCDSMPDFPLFTEFRNGGWQNNSVIEELEKRGIGVISTDMPIMDKLPGNTVVKTGDDIYIRLHGRNNKNWWNGDNISRYDYLYSNNELHEKFNDITKILDQSKRIFIAFNNHYKGQAVQNAKSMQKLFHYTGAVQ